MIAGKSDDGTQQRAFRQENCRMVQGRRERSPEYSSEQQTERAGGASRGAGDARYSVRGMMVPYEAARREGAAN